MLDPGLDLRKGCQACAKLKQKFKNAGPGPDLQKGILEMLDRDQTLRKGKGARHIPVFNKNFKGAGPRTRLNGNGKEARHALKQNFKDAGPGPDFVKM
ncbi:histidine kinase [Sesbania bispinosa]|nr:histidine kinase [Sesbania bispinosa]